MNNSILITRPEHDVATSYISYYAGLIIKDIISKGIAYKDFQGKELIAENVHKFLVKQDPKLLFLNGHGSEDAIEGSRGTILFSIKDKHLLKDRMIYARSCHLGARFGKEIVEKGCFIGYDVPFMFYTDTGRPSNDKVASYVLEPSNEVMNALLKGNTALVAHNRSKEAMRKNMNKLLVEGHSMYIVEALWNNYNGQVIYGDGTNSIHNDILH